MPEGLYPEVASLWQSYIQQSLTGNQALFDQILHNAGAGYRAAIWLLWGLLAVGVAALLAAVGLALATGSIGLALIFAALSAVALAACGLNRPLRSQEEHLYTLMSLGVAYNSYWAKLAHLHDPAQAQQEVERATNDTMTRLQTLAANHAERNRWTLSR
jgi:hypothetical protein